MMVNAAEQKESLLHDLIKGATYVASVAGGGSNPPPNKRSRNEGEPTVITDHYGNIKFGNLRGTGPKAYVDSVVDNTSYHDSNLLVAPGEQKLRALKFVAGPALYPDHKKHLMQQLYNTGITRCSWAGRILVPTDSRRFHHQFFRHNLSENTAVTPPGAAYPAGMLNQILTPNNSEPWYPSVNIDGTPTSSATAIAANTQPFRDMGNNVCYYAPDNRSDLEDMSWNANRFKPLPFKNGVAPVPSMLPTAPDAATFVADAHSRNSMLFENNNRDGFPSGSASQPAGFTYKACLNEGTIKYNFMNKGLGPAKIECILWKVKKNHRMSYDANDYDNVNTYPMLDSIKAMQEGWLNSNLQVASTDDYAGRVALASDITTNPHFPFLPLSKKTRQRNVDFSEVGRQVFAMPSGGRRNVSFKLPGELINPVNIATETPSVVPPVLDTGLQQPVMTEHTYCITIAVCGARATMNLEQNTPAATVRVGDSYCEANVQFYCTYEEKVGPCVYVPPQRQLLYNHGGINEVGSGDTAPSGFTKVTNTMLNQGQSVRLNPQQPNQASNAAL